MRRAHDTVAIDDRRPHVIVQAAFLFGRRFVERRLQRAMCRQRRTSIRARRWASEMPAMNAKHATVARTRLCTICPPVFCVSP
jgi:hypothetical protein